MKKIIFISAIISLVLISCQQVVDADKLLDVEERVSIIAFLSPSDLVLRIHVSKALPAIGTPIQWSREGIFPEEFLITNALVSIANDSGDIAQLNYDAETNTYLTDAANLPIEINRNYFLNVVVDGKEYNATCTIPEKIEEINETISFNSDEFGNEIANINLSFNDFIREKNYYVLGGRYNASIQFEGEESFSTSGSIFFDRDEFLTDNLNNGGILNGTGEVFLPNRENIIEATITLQVANVEEILYQYLRSSKTNGNAEGNPFVEYAIAPNNILDEGAIGIFAGYSITEKVIEIEQD